MATTTTIRSAATTRTLLGCGAVAGPLFLVITFAQVATREGFDLRRHPFSMLSLGDPGWVQITAFVVTGLLFLAAAVGTRRVLAGRRGGTGAPALLAAFGVSLIGGGVFVADPASGFPPGTADGPPAVLSWHGTAHGIAFALGMTALIAAFAVLSRAFAAAGDRAWARGSAVTGVAFVVLGGLGAAVGDWRLVAAAVVLGWSWASLVLWRLRTAAG
jgi:hypothetical protein